MCGIFTEKIVIILSTFFKLIFCAHCVWQLGVSFQIEWQDNKSNEIYLEKLQVAEDNRTVSTLVLSAKREMHGGKLSCKVENPLVPKSQIKDDLKLQIQCK